MKRQDPWEIYQVETRRRRWIRIPIVQAVVACCLLVGVWMLSATSTRAGQMSGQVVWQATRMEGDFSPMWSAIDAWWHKLTAQSWSDSVRAVTARSVSPFHHLEKPIEGVVVTSFGMGQDGSVQEAVEWEAEVGSSVKAVAAGRVIDVVRDETSGTRAMVMQSGVLTIRYGYLAETWVAVGDTVTRGQTIGCSGKKDGKYPRLSLAIRERGKAIDPLTRITDSTR